MAIELFPSSTPPTPPPPPSVTADNQTTTTSRQTPSRGISPRISFSHDLCQCEVVPVEPHLPLNPSSLFASANFNFYYSNDPPREVDRHFNSSTSADELFLNGVILPLQNLNISQPQEQQRQQSQSTGTNTSGPALNKSKSRSGGNSNQPAMIEERNENSAAAATKSTFWKFKRSRSFNCGRIYRGTLCPLHLLSRSKSTGSSSSSKRSLVSHKEEQKYQSFSQNHKQRNTQQPPPPSNISSLGFYKPPLKKGGNGAGWRSSSSVVSPLLNVPSGNLFGIRSIFCNTSTGIRDNKRSTSNKKLVRGS